MENTPSWDSISHLDIILALQDRFSYNFSPTEMADATSVKDIAYILNTEE